MSTCVGLETKGWEKKEIEERESHSFFSVLPIIIFNYHVSRVFDSISGNEQK